MITFTPLAGSASDSPGAPLSYLLQIDDARILLDCGSPDWCPETPAKLDATEAYCNALRDCAPTVDLVLLSHGDLTHSGLYPYAFARWKLRAPAYTTLPVQAMARIAASEDADGLRAQENLDAEKETDASVQPSDENGARRKYVATPQEVNDAFDSVNTLRFSQPTHLQGKCQGITITAFNAGHTLGGSIWKIRSPSSGTILYAVHLNHTKERHLDGTILVRSGSGVFEPLARPDLLITDSERTLHVSSRRQDRHVQLIDSITSTLSSRHSVLIPCDSGPRAMELLVLLDQHWTFSKIKYPICLISKTGEEMLTFVRSMMEWLGGSISKEDVGEDGGPNKKRKRDDEHEEEALGAFALRFRHLEILRSPEALLHKFPSKDPKLILAVPLSMSHGPSRSIFSEFACVPDNVVLLTATGEEGTLGRKLFEMWNDQQRDDDKWGKGKLGRNVMMDGTLMLTMKSKTPLKGAELEEYLQKEKAAKEKEAAQQAALSRTQRMLEADEDETDSDSDSDNSGDEDVVEQTLDVISEEGGSKSRRGLSQDLTTGHSRRRAREVGDSEDWGVETEDGTVKHLISYDIYLKGNVSKSTSFFKTAGSQTQRFRMFPYIERRRKVDEYGETVDIGMWIRKGKIFEQEAELEDTKEVRKRKQAEEEAKRAQEEPPSKFVSQDIEVQLACRLLFVDMEGLNDGRAVKAILPQVNPRKLILVHGDASSTSALIEACGSIRSMTKDIFAPTFGETVQIGQHTNSFSISLAEELLSTIKMSKFEDNEVGFVAGCIASHASSVIPILEPLSKHNLPSARPNEPRAGSGVLASWPLITLPQSTMIGELKLTALKSRLAEIGVRSEFAGEGILICGDKSADFSQTQLVAVRKSGKGNVELEGPTSDLYYTVRREVYNLHALVAG